MVRRSGAVRPAEAAMAEATQPYSARLHEEIPP